MLRNGQPLSNEVYRKFNHIDSRVATRELRELAQRGFIRSVSSGRWTTYRLTETVVPDAGQAELGIELPEEPEDREPLSDKARSILTLLSERGELASSEIAAALKLPGSTTRYWLKRLREGGLVEPTDDLHSPNLKHRLAQ